MSPAVAAELRAIRARKQVPLSDIAEATGRNSMWVSRKLRGEGLRLEDVELLARALDVDPFDVVQAARPAEAVSAP